MKKNYTKTPEILTYKICVNIKRDTSLKWFSGQLLHLTSEWVSYWLLQFSWGSAMFKGVSQCLLKNTIQLASFYSEHTSLSTYKLTDMKRNYILFL